MSVDLIERLRASARGQLSDSGPYERTKDMTITRLRRQRRELSKIAEEAFDLIATLQAREAELVEALRPFAELGDLIETESTGFDEGDELSVIVEEGHLLDRFIVADFLRARTTLSRTGEG